MRRLTKVSSAKALIKAASAALAPSYPAWIDASESALVPRLVIPRIRDALILRPVQIKRALRAKHSPHASGAC